ncbi:MAG TPA: hypothetical protein PKV86_01075 [Syntrophobacteraceae bacterium]|nr:hypothetical protein [Syntrophobacteraceae bacterium]
MQTVLQWLYEPANILTLLQVFLDVVLILLVIIFLARRPKEFNTSAYEELTTSLEKIINETKQLASEFDVNLQERHQLIQQITAHLDTRLDEARSVCRQLEAMQQGLERTAGQEPAKRTIDQQEVLRLARKGLSAESVAAKLKKPIGEVELILKLNKLSGN